MIRRTVSVLIVTKRTVSTKMQQSSTTKTYRLPSMLAKLIVSSRSVSSIKK